MAFDTEEKRRSAIHLTKRGALPVPKALIDASSRLHFIGVFSNLGSAIPTTFFWRNRSNTASSWGSQLPPQTNWGVKVAPATKWINRIPPPDGSTQTE